MQRTQVHVSVSVIGLIIGVIVWGTQLKNGRELLKILSDAATQTPVKANISLSCRKRATWMPGRNKGTDWFALRRLPTVRNLLPRQSTVLAEAADATVLLARSPWAPPGRWISVTGSKLPLYHGLAQARLVLSHYIVSYHLLSHTYARDYLALK